MGDFVTKGPRAAPVCPECRRSKAVVFSVILETWACFDCLYAFSTLRRTYVENVFDRHGRI
jgi:ribosomal protein L37AE/L43A